MVQAVNTVIRMEAPAFLGFKMKQLLITLCIFLGGVTFGMLFQKSHLNLKKIPAFKECIEEVETKCSSLISYATALETENAKLNKKCKQASPVPVIEIPVTKDYSDASF